MEQLFAPWRIEWVTREKPPEEADECVFCTFIDASPEDRSRLVVARMDAAYVLLNNYPYNPGHLLVIPHTHTGELHSLDGPARDAFETLTYRSIEALESAFDPDGFNTGCNLGSAVAGGSIGDHVHRHIVPRWSGDTNFMPIIGGTKVLVQALEDTYDALYEAFAAQPGADTVATGGVRIEE